MTVRRCDLLVVGGGPGGYTAAIRGAQKGLKTILVERGPMGGTCLNRGCVPTKTLLEDSLLMASTRNCPFMKGEMKVSLGRMKERRNRLVENSRGGIANVLKENGVEVLGGRAFFTGPRTMTVDGADGEGLVEAPHIIIATGARAEYGPGLEVDGRYVWSTDDALDPDAVPRTLAVVGGGNRGVEFAGIFHNLGARVVLIEKERRILPRFPWELSDRYKKALLDRGIKALTRTTLLEVRPGEAGGRVLTLESGKGREEIPADRVLLTGTRRPAWEDLRPEAAGLSPLDGRLPFGEGGETRVKGVYVVGDASGPPYLAHKAIAQGMAAVDRILGKGAENGPLLIPDCVYGDPEAASVGLTEEEARERGRRVRVGEFHFVGNGRAGTQGREEGLVTIVSDSGTGEVLGVHMIGPRVTELISLATLAIRNRVDVAGIKGTVFPHPSLSETFFEAALATDGEAVHMYVEREDEDGPGE